MAMFALVFAGISSNPVINSATAATNLVSNGDFETPIVINSAKWDIYPSGTTGLGWTVDWMPGQLSEYGGDTRPQIANLELHRNVLGTDNDVVGEQYAELDSDWYGPSDSTSNEPANIKVYQTISTIPGATYELSYAWRLRPSVNCSMKVWWNGSEVGAHAGTGGSTTAWNTVGPIEVVADSNSTEIAFFEDGNPDSLGMFLDSVTLTLKELPICYEPGESVYASEVIDYDQGLRKDGTPVVAARSIPEQGLVYEAAALESSFFSLGFGGWIIVGFDDIIVDGSGVDDLKITEDTWGSPYPLEKADVYVSQELLSWDDPNWVPLGVADNTNLDLIHTTSVFDLADVNLDWAKYVKIVDTTDPDLFANIPTGDGYDLNAVEAISAGYIGECEEVNAELVVSKTVATSFTRTYDWKINKTADVSEITLATGEILPVNYSVSVDATSYDDSDFAVIGIISIRNDGTVDAYITDISDVISNSAESVEVDCGNGVSFPYTLAAGNPLDCVYSASLLDGTDRVNTATVTVLNNDQTTSEFSDTADVIFSEPTIEVDECITVDDTYEGGPQDVKVCASDALKTLTYSRDIVYYDPGTYPVENTASFVSNDTQATSSASYNITVNVPVEGCTLTYGYWKTHSIYGPAAHPDDAWDLVVDNGPDKTFFLSGQTWYDVLWTPPTGGNVYYQLAHQYIAAKLNILNGASITSEVHDAIVDAEKFFNDYTPEKALDLTKTKDKVKKDTLQSYRALATFLDHYNNGQVGPGHCDEPRYSRLVETLQVPANSATGVSSMPLENGKDYQIRAIGTANAGDSIEFDAKYSFRTDSSIEWTDLVSNYESQGSTLLDLQINNASPAWGPYNDLHQYQITHSGAGSALQFKIYDIYYPNNTGYLTVEIYQLD